MGGTWFSPHWTFLPPGFYKLVLLRELEVAVLLLMSREVPRLWLYSFREEFIK